jgi:nucleoside 2-deoxyribosyltransferase
MKTKIHVYLSGPMWQSKKESTEWRNRITKALRAFKNKNVCFEVLDPCVRWFDDKNYLYENSKWITQLDKMEIHKAKVVIVNANHMGTGTPMENYISYNNYSDKIVIAFREDGKNHSIWTKEHSHVLCKTIPGVLLWLFDHAEEIGRTV